VLEYFCYVQFNLHIQAQTKKAAAPKLLMYHTFSDRRSREEPFLSDS
jgi:hypothetical protein